MLLAVDNDSVRSKIESQAKGMVNVRCRGLITILNTGRSEPGSLRRRCLGIDFK